MTCERDGSIGMAIAAQSAEQIVEQEVRELVRHRGLDPSNANGDANVVRSLIDEVVADYADRSLTAAMPPLADPQAVANAVADQVVGLLGSQLGGHVRRHNP